MAKSMKKRAAPEKRTEERAATDAPTVPRSASPMKQLSSEVLKMFSEMQRERLDLHVMFESSGNEPEARAQVLDAVEDLVHEGFLQSAGGDYYVLTEKGKRAVTTRDREEPSPQYQQPALLEPQ